MRCGFWHDSIMGPPKMEKRKASKPQVFKRSWQTGDSSEEQSRIWFWTWHWGCHWWDLLMGLGTSAQICLCSYVEGSLAENPWKPHTQGFRLLPWTWLLPYTLTWYIEAQIKGTEKEFRKQLVIPSVRSEPRWCPDIPHTLLPFSLLPKCTLSSPYTRPSPYHCTYTCTGISVCIFGFWLVSEQADLRFQSICWVPSIIYAGSGLGD